MFDSKGLVLKIFRPTVAVSGKEAVNGNGNAKKTQ